MHIKTDTHRHPRAKKADKHVHGQTERERQRGEAEGREEGREGHTAAPLTPKIMHPTW
jgi:hypothetical protein